MVTRLAGGGSASGTACGSADGSGPAATFSDPRSLALDNAGNVYVADYNNNMIRKISPAGILSC